RNTQERLLRAEPPVVDQKRERESPGGNAAARLRRCPGVSPPKAPGTDDAVDHRRTHEDGLAEPAIETLSGCERDTHEDPAPGRSASARIRAALTARRPARLRYTGLGEPVVPEVKSTMPGAWRLLAQALDRGAARRTEDDRGQTELLRVGP